jgi:glucose-1-phosphate thymidylyltransferase
MKIIIPVAGEGTRLRPHTYAVPKVLLPVAGKPMLAYLLDELKFLKKAEFVFIVGHLGEDIERFVKEYCPDATCFFIQQERREGLAQAVRLGLTGSEDEVLVILGDTLFDTDLKTVVEGNYSALAIMEVEDPHRFGVVEVKDGFIINLVEKPQKFISDKAIAGIYYFKNPALLKQSIDKIVKDNIRVKGEYQITDAIRLMGQAGEKIVPFDLKAWYDCGTQETLLLTNRALLAKFHSVGGDFEIHNSMIIPPAFIDKKSVIRNSVVGPNVSIGKNVHITDCRIEDSIISCDCVITRMILSGSILGEKVRIVGAKHNLNIGNYSQVEFI